jgi:hypothetical protein
MSRSGWDKELMHDDIHICTYIFLYHDLDQLIEDDLIIYANNIY